ncbi:CLUMA_CG017453, isoform A [Clunio marinus]|uniref:CLUMA_CG017453, isoform A n=1 Tax=Clunio marinus TaxID=568069 RepID=A0A1J1IW76_9DIPT|nr:CLUMA_CG017453, isoform A [Clunio marinus]
MSLRCGSRNCGDTEIAHENEIAFYQDLNNGGWCLGLVSEIVSEESKLPPNISLLTLEDDRFPFAILCKRCNGKLGKVLVIAGFHDFTASFSPKHTFLVERRHSLPIRPKGYSKWKQYMDNFSKIRRITANITDFSPLVGLDTIHFHGPGDLKDIFEYGKQVAQRSNLNPRRYQWRAFVFSCLNNCLMCLPTGMGKTLIANMVMKAYHQRNPNQGQVFIVPTVVLVTQQADAFEQNTGLKAKRRSSQHPTVLWKYDDICFCTPAMFVNAVRTKQIDMNQLSVLVLDEAHEGHKSNSDYGNVVSYIIKCPLSERPRILGLTASPSGLSTTDIHPTISSLCTKLTALPFSPLIDDEKNKEDAQKVESCYVAIPKSAFEAHFEMFVFDTLEDLSKLHDFFKMHWTPIPKHIFTKYKIDIALTNLQHSKLVAYSQNDNVLLQLTMLMTKWIDALDMFTIYGPKKVIESIREYLEFTQLKNHFLPFLNPILCKIKNDLSLMENRWEIPIDSPRVGQLLNYIKMNMNEQERILVFVERRNTTERLYRRLIDDEEFAKLNPEYLYSSNNNGMDKEIQRNVLKKFNEGKCRVLISTSVLEQGLDVSSCNVVICFNGVNSTTSIIQSRGRARKDKSKFIVFVSPEKQKHVNDLSSKESQIDYVICQLMNEYKATFDSSLNQDIENYLESINETFDFNETETNEEIFSDDDDDESDDENEKKFFKLQFFNYANGDDLAEHIIANFNSKYDRLTFKKQHIEAQFSMNSSTDDELKIIKNISSHSVGSKVGNPRSWMRILSSTENFYEMNIRKGLSLKFQSLSGFHFENTKTVELDGIWEGEIMMNVEKNQIIISKYDKHFIISAFDVDNPILINDSNNQLEVFICMRNPPSFFINNEYASFDFTNRSFNLCLRSSISISSELSKELFISMQSFSLQVFHVFNLFIKHDFQRPPINMPNNDFDKNYLIKEWHDKHAAVFPPILPTHVVKAFFSIKSTMLTLVLDATIPIRFQKLNLPQVKDYNFPFEDCKPLKNYAMIGRVKVTPSRIIVQSKELIQLNRVFRFFPDPQNFLLVKFSDEYDGNPWRSEYIEKKFLNILENGFEIGGKRFIFLGCSNSQLRVGHCWFSCLDRDEVYRRIGNFPSTMIAGRKLTRLALAFASSIETVQIDSTYLNNVKPDIKHDNICFSDGIGRASPSLFKKIQEIMDIPQHVSAFQVRIGGIRGVISLYDQKEDVMFRDSMKKFESSHNMLEVLNYSRPIKLLLNRHVILLLSTFGVSDKVFLDLQYNQLTEIMESLSQDETSLSFVKSHSKIFNWERFQSNLIVQEPFFRQLLVNNATSLVSGIVEHANIEVAKGRVLMGVLDETGTLKYGEIYAHIIEDGIDMVLEGTVIVFRNPCVLPSDIRILNARRHFLPENFKQFYKNCLVIPSRGVDSHARECAGGDLDGDLYYIIWDQNFIPPNIQPPGYKVVEVATQPISSHKSTVLIGNDHKEMMKFFCDYVSKNQLGILANAHLATSDKFGMCDERSIALARYVVAETDAPKKGFTVGKVKAELLPSEYPDFMGKVDKLLYRSKTILGDLYRQASPILNILLEKKPKLHSNPNFNIDYSHSIERHYTQYCFEIQRFLKSFELDSEAELFSGTPRWRRGLYSIYKQQTHLRAIVEENVKEFWKKWLLIFEKWLNENGHNQERIVEWYNRPKSSQWPAHSFSMLAFPYVDFEEKKRKTMIEFIEGSTKRWICYNKMTWLNEWHIRFNVGQSVMSKLRGIDCHFYGSSMLGLSEDFSDIDIYAADNNMESLIKALLEIDPKAFASKKPHECVSLTFQSLPIDVTNFQGGVIKSYGLAEVFDENEGLWPALRVLIEWGRTVNIIKSGGSQGIMTVISFCHMFVYCATKQPPKLATKITPYTITRISGWIDSCEKTNCGNLIYDFLNFLRDPKNGPIVGNMKDPFNGEPLIRRDLFDELNKNANIALYILALHDGDIRKMFEFSTKKRLFKIHKQYLDPTTATELLKEQALNHIRANCNPNNCQHLTFELLNRSGCFYLEVFGEHNHLGVVENFLKKIHKNFLGYSYRKLIRNKAHHIKSATMLIPEYNHGILTQFTFAPIQTPHFMPKHTGNLLLALVMRDREKNLKWEEEEYQRYCNRFLHQLEIYESKKRNAKRGTNAWRFLGELKCTIRTGNHYLFNVPSSIINSFETITLFHIERHLSVREEELTLESENKILSEIMTYNKNTLFQPSRQQQSFEDKKPLELMQLQEWKNRIQNKASKTAHEVKPVDIKLRTDKMRHSFYPLYKYSSHDKAIEFARLNGFREVQTTLDDNYTSISILWRQRELRVLTTFDGMIKEIKYRTTRWLSTSFLREDLAGENDVRVYLQSQSMLDEDDSCLETVIAFLEGRSIFRPELMDQIKNYNATGNLTECFTSIPLIQDMFRFNWRFKTMRYIVALRKFINSSNDVILLCEVHDGIFIAETREYEWFRSHKEFVIKLNVANRSSQELCQDSYLMALKLFKATK